MKRFTDLLKREFITYSLLFMLMLGSISLVAQDEEDDPRFDRIPRWYLEQMQTQEYRPSTVVTIDHWDNFRLGTDFAEGHVSTNPRNPLQFFACFNTNGTHHTEDGHYFTTNTPSFSGQIWGDPVSAYDSLGNLYYENMYGSGTVQGCKVVVSQTNGQTWSPAVIAISGIDKNWIAADQTGGPYSNYVYTVMTANSGGNFARSIDLGATWQNTWNFPTQSLPGMMVAVGPNGNTQGGSVYVVTNGGSTTASTYTFFRSTNGGQTFTQMSSQNWAGYVGTYINGRHSVQNMRTRPYPFIAADNSFGPYRGRLYCVYATNDPPGSGNKPDIWSRYSTDNGMTWSSAVRVNNDPNPTANHQWMPAIWCDKETGKLYVQWMDTRDVPTSDSCYIYATYSDNGGVSFKPNQRISNAKMKINCTTCGGGGTPAYQGDYNGIVSNANTSMAVWSDYRYGQFTSFATYFPDYAFKVEPATLSFSSSDTLWVSVPAVKLYTDPVIIQTSIQQPPTGTISFSYPEGFAINNPPGSIPVVITATDVPVGSYTATITGKGPNGTPVHKRTATLEILPGQPPTADFTASVTTLCSGSTVNYTDLSTNSPTQWAWEFPGGSPPTSNVQNPAGVVYNTPGVYDVTLTVTNPLGSNTMSKTEYITVNVTPEPPVAGGDVSVCSGEPVPDLTAEGENLMWYDDAGLTNLVNEGGVYTTGITEPGTYMFYVTQTTNDCPSDPVTITLTIYALPEVTFEPIEAVCADAPSFTLTGGLPEGGTYHGTGVTAGVFDPALAGTGTFDITYTYTDENSCTAEAVQTITVHPLPEVSLGNDVSICDGETTTLDAGAGFASYLWSDGSTEQTLTTGAAGAYSVTVTNEFGCAATSGTVTVTVLELVQKASTPTGPVEVDTYLQTTSTFNSEGALNATEYTWQIDPPAAGTLSASGTSAIATWANGFIGTALISLKGINPCGEGEMSDAISVQVYSTQGIGENKIGDIRIYPNPNQGTFTLKISTSEKKNLGIRITNALGEVIYNQQGVNVDREFSRQISLDGVSSGMLILKLDDGNETWQGKIFIQ